MAAACNDKWPQHITPCDDICPQHVTILSAAVWRYSPQPCDDVVGGPPAATVYTDQRPAVTLDMDAWMDGCMDGCRVTVELFAVWRWSFSPCDGGAFSRVTMHCGNASGHGWRACDRSHTDAPHSKAYIWRHKWNRVTIHTKSRQKDWRTGQRDPNLWAYL